MPPGEIRAAPSTVETCLTARQVRVVTNRHRIVPCWSPWTCICRIPHRSGRAACFAKTGGGAPAAATPSICRGPAKARKPSEMPGAAGFAFAHHLGFGETGLHQRPTGLQDVAVAIQVAEQELLRPSAAVRRQPEACCPRDRKGRGEGPPTPSGPCRPQLLGEAYCAG
jgi:hypothetical protein